MNFNVTPEDYAKIINTKKSHKRFLLKLKELGMISEERYIKRLNDNCKN